MKGKVTVELSEGLMQLPIVSAAPIVSAHAQAFRHFFKDIRQFDHFQNYLTVAGSKKRWIKSLGIAKSTKAGVGDRKVVEHLDYSEFSNSMVNGSNSGSHSNLLNQPEI